MGKLRKGHEMKIRSVSRKFKTWIKQLWEPRHDFETPCFDATDLWLAELAQEHDKLREDRIRMLTVERDRLKLQKRKFLHIQAEIESLRTEQLRG
jgi:hypothetical protein